MGSLKSVGNITPPLERLKVEGCQIAGRWMVLLMKGKIEVGIKLNGLPL